MAEDLKKMYRTIMDDHFPEKMEISFIDQDKRQTLFYEKVTWTIDAVQKGLRYGENPGQEAALYRMVNGNLVLGETGLGFEVTRCRYAELYRGAEYTVDFVPKVKVEVTCKDDDLKKVVDTVMATAQTGRGPIGGNAASFLTSF